MPNPESNSSNPYRPGTLEWLIWNIIHGPKPNESTVQRVVFDDKSLDKALKAGWTFVAQLQSGAAIVGKNVSVEKIAVAGLEVAKKNLHTEFQAL